MRMPRRASDRPCCREGVYASWKGEDLAKKRSDPDTYLPTLSRRTPLASNPLPPMAKSRPTCNLIHLQRPSILYHGSMSCPGHRLVASIPCHIPATVSNQVHKYWTSALPQRLFHIPHFMHATLFPRDQPNRKLHIACLNDQETYGLTAAGLSRAPFLVFQQLRSV
jgi:hypothetical protein